MRRWDWGILTLGIGAALGLTTPLIAAQVSRPGTAIGSWAEWLQVIVNLMKVVELAAFTFSAYHFWAGRRERRESDAQSAQQSKIDANYQAWQVINSAQGKGGSGGRIEALCDLLANGVSLAGINLDDAWLEGVELPGATLVRSSLQRAHLSTANLAGANLAGADLRSIDLVGANLTGAYLKGANLTEARLSAAILDGADLTDVIGWREIKSISHASIEGVRHPPIGFVGFARAEGAVDAITKTMMDNDDVSFSQNFRTI